MNIKKKLVILFFLIIVSSSVNYIIRYILELLRINNSELFQYTDYIRIGLYLILGFLLVTVLSDEIRTRLKPEKRAILASNIIKYLAYVLVLLVILIPLIKANGSGIIAGGTFAGLVFGLALQPVLENFFAGLLILLTGYIKIGDHIRIASTSIPYLTAQFPAYKHFSTDLLEQGYKGTVIEVGLFYSIVLLNNGKELKIPNIVLMRSSIIDNTPKYSKYNIFNVRVEFPLNVIDITTIEDQVREQLKDFDIVEGPYINEQSDKEFVIILVRIRVSEKNDWKKTKSEALKRLLKLRQELVKQQQKISNTT